MIMKVTFICQPKKQMPRQAAKLSHSVRMNRLTTPTTLRGLTLLAMLGLSVACGNDPAPGLAGWNARPGGSLAPPATPAGDNTTVPVADAGGSDAPLILRRHVVILSLDGCRPDAFAAAKARNLMRFGSDNTRAARAMTIPMSLTLPSHSSMLSGYDLEHHGVNWNTPQPELGYIKVPTIFSIAHAAGLRTVMVMGKGKFLTLQLPDTLDEIHEVSGDETGINDQAIFIARKGNFDLMFIHFPNPDLTGHLEGWMSPGYLARIANIDLLFAKLLAALPSDATVIVTADHGGHDFGHGEDIEVDRHIPWMIKGPGIRKKYVLNRQITTMDTAATALKVLGLSLGADAQGVPVNEVFSK
jgi:hypothetical protein